MVPCIWYGIDVYYPYTTPPCHPIQHQLFGKSRVDVYSAVWQASTRTTTIGSIADVGWQQYQRVVVESTGTARDLRREWVCYKGKSLLNQSIREKRPFVYEHTYHGRHPDTAMAHSLR